MWNTGSTVRSCSNTSSAAGTGMPGSRRASSNRTRSSAKVRRATSGCRTTATWSPSATSRFECCHEQTVPQRPKGRGAACCAPILSPHFASRVCGRRRRSRPVVHHRSAACPRRSWRNRLAPSDKLNIACIGVGGMGANDVRGVGKTENIYALCDVDDRQGAQSFQAFPQAKRFKDFRVMLDKEGKSIDAVTVSTPDHIHTVAGMAAMKLGKHTRIQKPLARTLWEVKQLEDMARKSKVATQMGNQG